MAKRVVRWFSPGIKMSWRKTDKAVTRRRNALKSHGGSLLSTARALQQLSNVTRDAPTKRLARSDALYFFGRYKKER